MPSVITPRDFSSRVTDPNRDTWTPETIQWVIDALDEAVVIIETDRRTGHAQHGRLTGYTSSGLCGGASATVHVEDSIGRTTRFLLFQVGVIVELAPMASAKWKALDLQRNARRAAIDLAKAQAGVDDDKLSIEVYGIGNRTFDVTFRDPSAPSYAAAVAHARVKVPVPATV